MEASHGIRVWNNLNGARVEGRLENVQTRRKEIQKLHSGIQANVEELVLALKNDLEWSEVDALLELSTVLQSLRALFKSLDIKIALGEEHAVAAEKKDIARHRALGNILIVGEKSAPVTQSIIPVCLAISEGNTAALVLPFASPETSAKLLEIVNSAIDQDAVVAFSPKNEKDADSLLATFSKHRFHAVVSQSSLIRAKLESLQFRVKSPDLHTINLAPRPSIVIVTRNADIKLAAMSVAQAKFSFFSGACPAAPGLVLVDEFALEEFLKILQGSIGNIIANRAPAPKRKTRTISKLTAETIKLFSKANGGPEGNTIHIGPDGSGETLLVGAPNSSPEYIPNLQNGDRLGYPDPVLPIVPTTSLEAALAITSKSTTDSHPFVLYLFSNPSEARYLSLFSNATATYINSLPVSTAVSIFPPSQVVALQPLFCSIDITYAPKILASTIEAQQLEQALTSGKGKMAGLNELLMEVLEPPKQRSGFQVGFFPQGGFIGLGHIFALFSLLSVGLVVGIRRSLT